MSEGVTFGPGRYVLVSVRGGCLVVSSHTSNAKAFDRVPYHSTPPHERVPGGRKEGAMQRHPDGGTPFRGPLPLVSPTNPEGTTRTPLRGSRILLVGDCGTDL